ncbi:MAG: hypothetical protein ACRD3D_11375 [Terriglobia bacterium]
MKLWKWSEKYFEENAGDVRGAKTVATVNRYPIDRGQLPGTKAHGQKAMTAATTSGDTDRRYSAA